MDSVTAPHIRSKSRAVGSEFLRAPLPSDEISLLKAGGRSDAHSFMALYRSDGREEGITSPRQMDGYMGVVVLEDMKAFTLRRNNRYMRIPPTRRGTVGLHDLRHAYSSPKYPVCSFSFVFSEQFLQELRPGQEYRARDLQESVNYLNRDDTLLHLSLALLPAFTQPTPSNRLFVDQIFLAASIYLAAKFGGEGPPQSPRGRLTPRQEKIAKEFLAAKVQDNVSLEEVAALCELSPANFARLFKRSTGMTPYQWFIQRRLALAKYLLESTDDSLAQIAFTSGFAHQSHFTRTFSRIIGLSPGAWRRLERR